MSIKVCIRYRILSKLIYYNLIDMKLRYSFNIKNNFIILSFLVYLNRNRALNISIDSLKKNEFTIKEYYNIVN